MTTLESLEAEWAEFMRNRAGGRGSWTQDQRWRNDNPGRLSQLLVYRDGGARPTLPTGPPIGGTFERMIYHLDAYRSLKPAAGWAVEAPRGTLTEHDGRGVDPFWRFDYTTGPVLVEGMHLHDYTSYGYGLMQWVNGQPVETPPGVRSTIRDLRIERVTRTPPRSSNGTAEAPLWVGQTADVSRVELVGGAWMQYWAGARHYRSVSTDVRMIDTQLVGIYPEHQTWNSTWRRFINEQSQGIGNIVNQEWAYDGEFSKGLVYDQFDLYVPKGCWAFFIDAGNGETQVAPSPGSRIWGPGNGVIFPKRVVAGVGPNRVWLENIDMSELAGTKYAEHDNAIGTFTTRLATATRGLVGLAPKHHPGTIRMPVEVTARLNELARSA